MEFNLHLKRWITSIVILPFIILLVYKGNAFLFSILISLAALITLWEYFQITLKAGSKSQRIFIAFLGFIISPIIIWAAHHHNFEIIIGLLSFNLIISSMISIMLFRSDVSGSNLIIKQVLGIIYIPTSLAYLVLLRNGNNGLVWISILLCIVFAGDIGSFYVGSYLGRHKLCPAVSPGKTIEGSIGGLAANLFAGSILKFLFLPLLSWNPSLIFFIAIGLAGQAGDLFESRFKRTANVKDSGVILPGHGGLLDRIDALIFAAPVAYFFKKYILTLS